MKIARIVRGPSGDEGTFGIFTTSDGALKMRSLELPWVDLNNDGIGDQRRSCITAGDYECVWQESPKFGWCYEVTNVTGRSDIRFHRANFAGNIDKGWKSEMLGCIALGYRVGRVVPKGFRRLQLSIIRDKLNRGSGSAIEALHGWGQEQPFKLIIRDNPSI